MPIDPDSLPQDAETLRKIVVDLAGQLDRSLAEQNKYQSLLRELLEAQRNRKSEQLSKDQLALFEAAWQARGSEDEAAAVDDDDLDGITGAGPKPDEKPQKKGGGRQPLTRHLTRERIVHDLAEAEKHCQCCGKDLRLIAEETSEHYDYIPASMRVIQDVCLKYACDCTIKTATKPPQPIETSTAGASLLAQVLVAKWADHQPLHRQEKMLERHGIEISRKTMGGWMAQCAELLDPLYQLMKKEVLGSKVIGTDDTSVKVLDRKLPFARIGRIWPYVGDAHHPVIVYDYTPTRSRAGPAKFLEGYRGYLQADAYSVYDAFFKSARGMTEVGCWMHARRYSFKALESDEPRMGLALHLIARLYAVEERAKALSAEQRFALRKRLSARLLGKLHQYLLELQQQVLPKSPSGAAVRYALNQWEALTRFLEDGELEIDNGATERANRDIALGRGNWTFFGSDTGGKTAAVLRSFIASCKRCGVEPFAWFRDVLSRIPAHSIQRLNELLPQNWNPLVPQSAAGSSL
ncbi:MAG: IS66-like element IS682 family transposase [Acidobacteriaceae bacterium]